MKKRFGAAALSFLMLLLVGRVAELRGGGLYFEPLSALRIPEEARIVAFGEATHGNHEFKSLANEVFKRLVLEYGFRAFAIEAQFGNIMAINEYILYGIGTARTAVRRNGFWVHDFQEVIDLVEWMREFNLTAEEGDELRFYGYDMQQVDVDRARYLDFIRMVDPERAVSDTAAFGNIGTAGLFAADNETLLEIIGNIDVMIYETEQNREAYVLASSQKEFDFAMRNLLNVRHAFSMATLISAETAAAISGGDTVTDDAWTEFNASFEYRDFRMFENIVWIVEQEEKLGRGRVFVFGHNGHVQKSLYMGLHGTGRHLYEKFGDGYFVIGTEFYMNTVLAINEGRLAANALINDSSELIKAFVDTDTDIAVLDIRRHIEASRSLSDILTSYQNMGTVGAVFSSYVPANAWVQSVIPSSAFDAIIFVRNATPATRSYR